jgi:hypothetical protein
MLTIIRRGLRPCSFAGLAVALILAGCGAPGAVTTTPAPQPTVVPTTLPTNAPQSTVVPTTPPTGAPQPPPPPTQVPQPSAVPQPTAGATQPGQADTTAAVQTVLDYYTAIEQKKFDDAYRLWANNGAASGQTLDQFKQGFANTAGLSLQLGTPTPGPGPNAIEVPVMLIAITNDPNPSNPQKVQQYRGGYTVLPGANGWQLAGANISEVNDRPLPPAEFSDPVKLLHNYYDLINGKELATAYTFWSDNGANSQQTFAQFVQGFAATNKVAIELGQPQAGGAAGSIYVEIPTLIVATQNDGSQQAYCGSYTLRKLNVPPFDQFGLRIEGAAIAPTALVQPGGDQAKQLLAGGCKQS